MSGSVLRCLVSVGLGVFLSVVCVMVGRVFLLFVGVFRLVIVVNG